MKAIKCVTGPIDAVEPFISFDAPEPELGEHDVLVEVRGISVNPVDTKVRAGSAPKNESGILGFDGAGIVSKVGSAVTSYNEGDEVFYAGDITRAGSNAQFQAVDERIVGRKPKSLDFAEAAGMALTSITAWELLFDRIGIAEGGGEGEQLVIIGGAGGVGSILIQLAKKLTKLEVIATASRPETVEWVLKMGADHVVNHHKPLTEQIKAIGVEPRYVAGLNGSDKHLSSIIEFIKPGGTLGVIDSLAGCDVMALKAKSLRICWEFMFTRSMFNTDDMIKQQELLNRVSALLDDGTLVSTVTGNLGALTIHTLREAHKLQEAGKVIGKNVLEGI